MTSGEPPYLLDRLNYLTDPAYAGAFDGNPMHAMGGRDLVAFRRDYDGLG
jgi:hypothetical protein